MEAVGQLSQHGCIGNSAEPTTEAGRFEVGEPRFLELMHCGGGLVAVATAVVAECHSARNHGHQHQRCQRRDGDHHNVEGYGHIGAGGEVLAGRCVGEGAAFTAADAVESAELLEVERVACGDSGGGDVAGASVLGVAGHPACWRVEEQTRDGAPDEAQLIPPRTGHGTHAGKASHMMPTC